MGAKQCFPTAACSPSMHRAWLMPEAVVLARSLDHRNPTRNVMTLRLPRSNTNPLPSRRTFPTTTLHLSAPILWEMQSVRCCSAHPAMRVLPRVFGAAGRRRAVPERPDATRTLAAHRVHEDGYAWLMSPWRQVCARSPHFGKKPRRETTSGRITARYCRVGGRLDAHESRASIHDPSAWRRYM